MEESINQSLQQAEALRQNILRKLLRENLCSLKLKNYILYFRIVTFEIT